MTNKPELANTHKKETVKTSFADMPCEKD